MKKVQTVFADTIEDVKTAQDTLTENARALARLALRVHEGEDALTLAQLRDTTADAVKRLERARLALLPYFRQEEQMNKNALAEQAERIARRAAPTGEQTWAMLQQTARRRGMTRLEVSVITFLVIMGIVATVWLLVGKF